MFERVGLIGCGLMGGSFALALRRRGLVKHIAAYSATTATLECALQMGVIDEAAASARSAANGADLVLLCVPVAASQRCFADIAPVLTEQALVMDVGSTKSDVVAAARAALGQRLACFVPAHPIAGKELSGIAHADADLYARHQVILTPTEVTGSQQLQQATHLWRALGCQVIKMSAQSHDSAFAAVSHLPHLLAFTLVAAIAGQQDGADVLALAGPGFRDFSRIAASDAKVWRDILLANRGPVLAQAGLFRRQLQQFETLLQSGDGAALEALLAQASRTRSDWRMGQCDEE